MTGEWTSSDLIAHVAAQGRVVSRGQLERWRQIGLLPKARRVGRGRGVGALWLHPSGTELVVSDLVTLHPRRLGLPEATVRLWFRGHDLDEIVIRKALRTAMVVWHRLRTADPKRLGAQFVDGLDRSAADRRRFGVERWDDDTRWRTADAVESVVEGFVHQRSLAPVDADNLSVFFAHDSSEVSAIASIGADLVSEVIRAFDDIRSAEGVVEAASWAELGTAREAARQLAVLISAVKDAPASPLRDATYRALRQIEPQSSMALVIMLLVMRRMALAAALPPVAAEATRAAE